MILTRTARTVATLAGALLLVMVALSVRNGLPQSEDVPKPTPLTKVTLYDQNYVILKVSWRGSARDAQMSDARIHYVWRGAVHAVPRIYATQGENVWQTEPPLEYEPWSPVTLEAKISFFKPPQFFTCEIRVNNQLVDFNDEPINVGGSDYRVLCGIPT